MKEKKNFSLIEYAESMPPMSYDEVRKVKIQSGIMANLRYLEEIDFVMRELKRELKEVKQLVLSLKKEES